MKDRRQGTLHFALPTITVKTPTGPKTHRLTLSDVRPIGETVRPLAHEYGRALLLNVTDAQGKGRELVGIQPQFAIAMACLLLTLPGSRRGRPPKESTLLAQQLLAAAGSKRKAARTVASKTGEKPETVRRRMRSAKPGKSKK